MASLNPCSCGRWLQRAYLSYEERSWQVLILVLVEDGFRVLVNIPIIVIIVLGVLILVLVEDGFRVADSFTSTGILIVS